MRVVLLLLLFLLQSCFFNIKKDSDESDSSNGLGVGSMSEAFTSANQIVSTEEDKEVRFKLLKIDSSDIGYQINVAPKHGKIEGCLDGTSSVDCTYIPSKDFHGEDEIKWNRVGVDTTKKENIAIIKIVVAQINDAPTVGKGQIFNLEEDQELDFSINQAKDVDKDDFKYKVVAYPENGTLGDCFLGDTLRCSYVPAKDYSGEDSFSYKVVDSNETSSEVVTITFLVKEINDAPVPRKLDVIEMNEDTEEKITAPVAYDAEESDLFYSIVDAPKNGRLECLSGSGLECVYTPKKDFFGKDSFSYKVRDSQGLFSIPEVISLNVKNVNDIPTSHNQVHKLHAGESFLVTIDFNDIDSPDVSLVVDKSRLNGRLETCEQVITQATCVYRSDVFFTGNDSFTYVLKDGENASQKYTVNFEVLPSRDSDFDLVPDLVETENGTDPFSSELLRFVITPKSVSLSVKDKQNTVTEIKSSSEEFENISTSKYLNEKLARYVFKKLNYQPIEEQDSISALDVNRTYLSNWSILNRFSASSSFEKLTTSNIAQDSGDIFAKYDLKVIGNEAIKTLKNPKLQMSFLNKSFLLEELRFSSMTYQGDIVSSFDLDNNEKSYKNLQINDRTVSPLYLRSKVMKHSNLVASLKNVALITVNNEEITYLKHVEKVEKNTAKVIIKTDEATKVFFVSPTMKLSRFLSYQLDEIKYFDEKVISANGFENEVTLPIDWSNVSDQLQDKHFWYSSKDKQLEAGKTYVVGYFKVAELLQQTERLISSVDELKNQVDFDFNSRLKGRLLIEVSEQKLTSFNVSERLQPLEATIHYLDGDIPKKLFNRCTAKYRDLTTTTAQQEMTTDPDLLLGNKHFKDFESAEIIVSKDKSKTFLLVDSQDVQLKSLKTIQAPPSSAEVGFIGYSEYSNFFPRGFCGENGRWGFQAIREGRVNSVPRTPHSTNRSTISVSPIKSYSIKTYLIGQKI